MNPGPYPRDFGVEMRLELSAYIQQLTMCKAEDDDRSGIQFGQGKILEAIDCCGIIGPYFNAAVEIHIGRTEEISSAYGAQQARWFLQGINLIVHAAFGV